MGDIHTTNKLLHMLTPETTAFAQKVSDWREAIRLAGQLLLKEQSISAEYIDECVQVAEEVGAYFVVRPGVAISHARPGENVKRVCLSTVTLDPPVCFGHPDNDPVTLLFMFGTRDNDGHIDLLRDLSKVLSNDEMVERIMKATEFKPMYDDLHQMLS
ncbi:MAG: PTS sugar transporter subunit IIA [Defluviitaleaceae bacterium]|nr:PTS sugar transporter subunit IIA [Defluviitaleaceae bacterium]